MIKLTNLLSEAVNSSLVKKMIKAVNKGEDVVVYDKKGRAGKIAKSMSKDDVDDFASTKHKGKPEKVKREQKVRELIKKWFVKN